MSSPPCLTGHVGKAYKFELEIFKSPITSSTLTSQTSSPSSTLSSENSTNYNNNNSQLLGLVSTRKTRTPRKRPNQTYNEAAALLSTAYPKLFLAKQHIGINPQRNYFTKRHDEYSEDLFYGSSGLKPQIVQSRFGNSIWDGICPSPGEVDSRILDSNSAMELDGDDDFDSESIILDEGIENGIDSIMGNIGEGSNGSASSSYSNSSWNIPLGLGVGMKMGELRAMRRHVDNGNWWCSPTVDVLQISPRLVNKPPPPPQFSEEKKKKKVEANLPKKAAAQLPEKENPTPKVNSGLILKLNYEGVVNAWSDRPSPFSDEISGSDQSGNDVSARLAQIDLFSDGRLREASVMRYKEKRRTRLFSKKIRYQVRKVNADRRPRMKGRFVRRPNSSTNGRKSKEEE